MRTFFILVAFGALALAGCGGDDDKASGPSSSAPADTATTAGSAGTDRTDTTTPSDSQPSDSQSSDEGSATTSGTTAEKPEYKPVDGDDRDGIATSVSQFYLGLATKDGAKACAVIASKTRKEFVQTLGRSPKLKGKSCAEALTAVMNGNFSAGYSARVKRLTVPQAFLTNNGVALARYKIPGEPLSVMPVTHEDGGWRVVALNGVPSDQVPIP